ncbi:hypothetical protein ASD98_20360 [Flavobacterium sp. Root186]|nr:hypothetical protein ASD98_20360 [Flavobacterium sp. Root186]
MGRLKNSNKEIPNSNKNRSFASVFCFYTTKFDILDEVEGHVSSSTKIVDFASGVTCLSFDFVQDDELCAKKLCQSLKL